MKDRRDKELQMNKFTKDNQKQKYKRDRDKKIY